MKKAGLSVILLGVLILVLFLIFRAPSIPHSLEGKKECLTCHAGNGIKSYPAWHAKRGYKNEDCSGCHDLKIDNRDIAGANTK